MRAICLASALLAAAFWSPAEPRAGDEPPGAAFAGATPGAGVRPAQDPAVQVIVHVDGDVVRIVPYDPEVELTLLSGAHAVRIRDKTGQVVELDLKTMSVRSTEGEVGLRVSGDRITLTRGNRTIVEIRREKRPARPVVSVESPPPVPGTETLRPLESRELAGHEDRITSVAFSPDNRWAATGSEDRTVRVWEVATGRQLRRFSQPSGPVAFSPDGRYLATAASDGGISLRDVRTWEEVKTLPRRGWLKSLAFSPKGDKLLSGEDSSTVRLWDVASGSEVRFFRQPMELVVGLAIAPDGRSALCTGGYFMNSDTPTGPLLRVWDLETGKTLFELHPGIRTSLSSAVFTPDGKSVLAEDPASAHYPTIWEIATGRKTREMTFLRSTRQVALSPDGRRAVAATVQGPLHLIDVDTWRLLSSFGVQRQPGPIVFSPDGRYLLAGGDKTARLYRMPQLPDAPKQSPAEVRRLRHDSFVYCAKFSPDARRILSGGFDMALRLWDTATGQELRKSKGDKASSMVNTVAWSPDGRLALLGAGQSQRSSRLSLWDVEQWKEIRSFEGIDDFVTCLAFSPDGRRAMAGTASGSVRCWDVGDGREISRFDPPVRWAHDLAFAPDGLTAVFAGGAGSGGIPTRPGADEVRVVRLWEVATGRELKRLEGHTGVVRSARFTLAGRHVVSAGEDRTIRIWDAGAGTLIRTIRSAEPIQRAVFSQDERLAVTASSDGPVLVWDLDSGREIGRLAGHDRWITTLDLSSDGRYALSGAYDQTIRIWDLSQMMPDKRPPEAHPRPAATPPAESGQSGPRGTS